MSSTTKAYNEEGTRLRSIFCRFDYPIGLTDSTVNIFVQNVSANKLEKEADDGSTL